MQRRKQDVPEDLKQQRLKYRVQLKLLGAVRVVNGDEVYVPLRESEARLWLAWQATCDVIWDWDVEHDAQRWSSVGAEVTLMGPQAGQIKLIVRDKGQGFDPDVVKKRRSDEVSFGLFSIQERLAYLGGQMEIESAPGRGTEIMLLVPTVEKEPPAEATRETAQSEERAATIKMRAKPDTCRVLLVDDHKIMREGLAWLLQFESDIEVVGEASDGPQAIELAGVLEPDVVIMDVNLGEMDGIEATRRILANDPEIKVIGLSMHIDTDVARAMRDAGARAYLTKGGPSEDLIAAIRACCQE